MNQTIFVSIASYRDEVCTDTIHNLFKNAQYPLNITVGLCQQNDDNQDTDCANFFQSSPYYQQIKTIRLTHYEAKGPTWARYLCTTLWNGEKYFFQIDSHTKFIKSWDTKLIQMIQNIKSQHLSLKPIISHYPKSIEEYDESKTSDFDVPKICKSFINKRNMISFPGAVTTPSQNKFTKGAYIAAGMLFSESTFIKDVPYDPHLDYLFVGEEILHSIRAYTHGYDVFFPTENVVYHEYTRKNKPKVWTDNTFDDTHAFNKVKKILSINNIDNTPISEHIIRNIDKYGLGTQRTIQEFYQYTGIDMLNRKVTTDFCTKNKTSPDTITETIEHFTNNISQHNKTKYQIYLLLIILILLYTHS